MIRKFLIGSVVSLGLLFATPRAHATPYLGMLYSTGCVEGYADWYDWEYYGFGEIGWVYLGTLPC